MLVSLMGWDKRVALDQLVVFDSGMGLRWGVLMVVVRCGVCREFATLVRARRAWVTCAEA